MSKKPRGILIAGNWKMNCTQAETESFFSALHFQAPLLALAQGYFKSCTLRATLFPPMLSLSKASDLAAKTIFPLEIGAQNIHWDKRGAFTGEISGPMALEAGIKWALVGHSERRQYFNETDETSRKRTESLLDQGFHVILCVGETRAEREGGRTAEIVTRQLNAVLKEAGKAASTYLNGTLIIAYEPVWAIGTGLNATPDQAEEAHRLIRELLHDRFGSECATRTPIIYGGSVTTENMESLLACANVDGALIGGASLKPESYAQLLAAGARALN